MNYFAFIIAAAAMLAGCGSATETNPDLAALMSERDSLKTVQRDLVNRIKDLDMTIANLAVGAELTQVTALTVQTAPFEHYFTVYGDLRSDAEAMVHPEFQGVIKSIAVTEGQNVSAGQTLMILDTSILQEQAKELEANYNLADQTFKKQESLWKQNIGSEMQYLQAKTQKESMEQAMVTLKKQISKGTVIAPFAGTVDLIVPKKGEMASPAMPVIRLVSMQNPHVKADVSESYFGRIQNGTKVKVVFPNIDTISTVISRVGSYIKPDNRTFEITVDIAGTRKTLSPNLFASIKVNDFSSDSAVTLPASLVFTDAANRPFVWVIEEDGNEHIVRKRDIETGVSFEGRTLINSGLVANERVVNKGAQRVTDAEPVLLIK